MEDVADTLRPSTSLLLRLLLSAAQRNLTAYSLKSAFIFSQPAADSSIPATLSASFIFKLRFFSVHNSYIVDRLNRSVCDDKPEFTSPSRTSRPCNNDQYIT